MPDPASRGAAGADPSPPAAELVLLEHRSPLARLAVAAAVIAVGLAWGLLSLRLQTHFAAEQAAGARLNLVAGALADGSGWRTAWPGWVAAFFFGMALLRLHRGDPEPPAVGQPRDGRSAVAVMREGLRSEYRTVRVALLGVVVVAGVDLVRAAVFGAAAAAGEAQARATLGATVVEALGLAMAALLLGAWVRSFGAMLSRWGAR